MVQGQADPEGFSEEEGMGLHRWRVWKFCSSPLPRFFFPISLHQPPGQSLLGASNPIHPQLPWPLGASSESMHKPAQWDQDTVSGGMSHF